MSSQNTQSTQTQTQPITDRPHRTIYLPETIDVDLELTIDTLLLVAKTQPGVGFGKNRHVYPIIVLLRIERAKEMEGTEGQQILNQIEEHGVTESIVYNAIHRGFPVVWNLLDQRSDADRRSRVGVFRVQMSRPTAAGRSELDDRADVASLPHTVRTGGGAHVLKQVMGWNGEKQLADHFETHLALTVKYGFVECRKLINPT